VDEGRFPSESSKAGDSQTANEPGHDPGTPDYGILLADFVSDLDEAIARAGESCQSVPRKRPRKYTTDQDDSPQAYVCSFP